MPEETGDAKPEGAAGVADEQPRLRVQPSTRPRGRFYRRYGRALAYWAKVELIPSIWFAWAIDPEEKGMLQTREIFYSARSFNGSADMLKAAFYALPRDEALAEFFRAAINRMLGYYAYRNRLAHYLPAYKAKEGFMIMQYGTDEDHIKPIVTEEDLVIAARNFITLARIWVYALPAVRLPRSLEPKAALQRIEALPGEAQSTALSQRQRGT